ncbi:Uncharacterised protein [Mycobacteroides abscessus subsp. massiliense]|nr:Uncharacterised protein [Mycobacteroides abscessus subsp. abscessus]SKQ84346.1 Uncharacterised protein [Mycobacteroides abscessus subsp. massiliense]SLC49449.1 Uncharacterised protein [Mycobacteroides abscessus subsp. massiliense]
MGDLEMARRTLEALRKQMLARLDHHRPEEQQPGAPVVLHLDEFIPSESATAQYGDRSDLSALTQLFKMARGLPLGMTDRLQGTPRRRFIPGRGPVCPGRPAVL